MRGNSKKNIFGPINPNYLTPEDRKMHLEAVNLIKEKKCVNIKVQTSSNVRKKNR